MESQLKSLSLVSLQEMQRKFLANRQQLNLASNLYQVHCDAKDHPYDESLLHAPEEVNLLAMLSEVQHNQDSEWLMDSGANSHFSKDKQNFSKFSPHTSTTRITTTRGAKLLVTGQVVLISRRIEISLTFSMYRPLGTTFSQSSTSLIWATMSYLIPSIAM